MATDKPLELTEGSSGVVGRLKGVYNNPAQWCAPGSPPRAPTPNPAPLEPRGRPGRRSMVKTVGLFAAAVWVIRYHPNWLTGHEDPK